MQWECISTNQLPKVQIHHDKGDRDSLSHCKDVLLEVFFLEEQTKVTTDLGGEKESSAKKKPRADSSQSKTAKTMGFVGWKTKLSILKSPCTRNPPPHFSLSN